MKKNKSSKNGILKRIAALIMAVFICLIFAFSTPTVTRADAVTDTLEIRVGYASMELSEYVQVGYYHWSELYSNLPLYEVAYSFFQEDTVGNGYSAIVDAARGFYITDILDYANVYIGDVYNLMFYVEDSQGIRSAFDTGSLFCTRYYFDNLPAHRKIQYGTKEVEKEVEKVIEHEVEKEVETVVTHEIETEVPLYNEDGSPALDENGQQKTETKIEYETEVVTETVTEIETEVVKEMETVTEQDYTKIEGYNFDECWSYCEQVQPMLAIEDNWASFNEEFESIGPDFTSANAGNRFRLLFGQTSPTESLTSKSDKYVSCIYVTLYGNPTFGVMEDGEAKYGSNTVELQVSDLYNTDINDALSQYLNIQSTNENVIRVDSIETVRSSVYSDVATVIIHYSVVGDGTASFVAGIGANDISADYSNEANIIVEDGKARFSDGSEPVTEPESTEPESSEAETKEAAKSSDSKKENQKTASAENVQQIDGEIVKVDSLEALPAGYALSDDIQKLLGADNVVVASEEPEVEIKQVMTEDNTEEKEEKQRRVLLYTGAGAFVICGLGAAAKLVLFKIETKKKISIGG